MGPIDFPIANHDIIDGYPSLLVISYGEYNEPIFT